MSKSYKVDGMSCGHCAQAVTDALKALKESANIQVDLDEKVVHIDGIDDDTAIANAIEDAGFDYMGVA